MNKENKLTISGVQYIPVLNYMIYYWDYRTMPFKKTLLYVGKAYNFNRASSIDIYLNDIIKNIPATSGYYDIPELGPGWDGTKYSGLNIVTNLEVSITETYETYNLVIYQDKTKNYFTSAIQTPLADGEVVAIPTAFNTLTKLHSDVNRQLNLIMIGNMTSLKEWGFKYVYTDGTYVDRPLGDLPFYNLNSHNITIRCTWNENFISYVNPVPNKTVKEVWFIDGSSEEEGSHALLIAQFTNEDCEYDVLSFENRNGSISYLPLKGNTIYSETIERYMKIDMFDRQEVYASLVNETITVNTGWLTDEQAKALEDLYVSKKVYLFDVKLGRYMAVNVDDKNYTKREFKNEHQLKNYTIKLKLQQKEIL